MKKKQKEKLYNYRELCEMFKEEPKKSSSRTNQFAKWRKEYNIEKVNGKNLYIVSQLLPKQQLELLNSSKQVTNNYKFLEPMFMYLLVNESNNKIKTTYTQLQEDLGLVNNNFMKVRYSKDNKEILAKSIGVSVEELNSFNKETYEINYTNLKNVIQKMEKLGLIYKQDIISVEYIQNGELKFDEIIGDDYSNFINERNKMSRQLFDNIYELLNTEEKENIKNEMNKKFGFIKHKQQFVIYSDTESINYCLDKNFNYLMNKQCANENNQLRIMKSKRGSLKELNNIKKNSLIDGVIALKEDNDLTND